MGLDITGLGAIFDFGSKIIDKIFPDKTAADAAKLRMFELQQQGDLKQLDQDFQLALEQIKANAVEAANPNVFVSGGRPAAMWVCVCGLFYSFIAQPLLAWAALIFGKATPPQIDITMLLELLLGMLGLSGLRSWEKGKGVASK